MKKILAIAASLIVVSGLQASSNTIKIGVQAPFTGRLAVGGISIKKGVEFVVNKANANGGINGKQLELISCDDKGKTLNSAICARKFVNEDVTIVVGSRTSDATNASQITYHNNKIIQTSAGTSDILTEDKYWNFFRNSFNNSAQAAFSIKYMIKDRGFKKIAIVSDMSAYSMGLAKTAISEVKKLGGVVVLNERANSEKKNHQAIIDSAKANGAEVIYFTGFSKDGGVLRKIQVKSGFKAEFIGGDANDNKDFIKIAGDTAVGALIVNFPTPSFLQYPQSKKFLKEFKKRYNEMPDSVWVMMNVDGLSAILHAIKTTKSEDPKVISNFLHNIEDFPGVTGPVSFASNGERIKTKFNVYEIQADNSYFVISSLKFQKQKKKDKK